MSRAASLLFPSHLDTTSPSTLSTCTPVRQSTRPSTRSPLTLSSHGDYTCVDPSNSSFGPVQDSTSATGHEPNLVEDSSMEIKPMFFHKPSMTSTCDTSESIATLPPESDLDDDQSQNMLASPLYLQEQVLTDDQFLTLSEKSQCPSHLMSEKVQGNLPRCSHTEESRVKTQFPTEKAFPQDIKQFVRFSNPTETIEVGSKRIRRSSTRRREMSNLEA